MPNFTYFNILFLCVWLQVINKVKFIHQGEGHIKVKVKSPSLQILCSPYFLQAGGLHSTECVLVVGELWIDVSHSGVEETNHCDWYYIFERCMCCCCGETPVTANSLLVVNDDKWIQLKRPNLVSSNELSLIFYERRGSQTSRFHLLLCCQTSNLLPLSLWRKYTCLTKIQQ